LDLSKNPINQYLEDKQNQGQEGISKYVSSDYYKKVRELLPGIEVLD